MQHADKDIKRFLSMQYSPNFSKLNISLKLNLISDSFLQLFDRQGCFLELEFALSIDAADKVVDQLG